MENIQKIEFNKTYIIEDIFSTGFTEFSKLKFLIDIKNSNFNENNKINCFFASTLEMYNKKPSINIFPLECIKICELILYLKTIYKERTKDNIFPFCFYMRKTKNDEIIFIPLDKKVRQLLFGTYEHIYTPIPIMKGFLYGFKCEFNSIEIYKTNIPSKRFLEILKNIDKNINISLNYNCMVCKKIMLKLKECTKCRWALYCSDECFNNKIFKNHISDDLLEKKLNYFDELKI
jgi:hypothetical protein